METAERTTVKFERKEKYEVIDAEKHIGDIVLGENGWTFRTLNGAMLTESNTAPVFMKVRDLNNTWSDAAARR